MSLSYLYGQISDAEQIIARLQQEMLGLERFRGQLNNEAATFEQQVFQKRSAISKTTALPNVKIAKRYHEKMDVALGGAFQENVYSCFDGADSQIIQAMQQVQAEIEEQRRRIGSLEIQIAEEKMREARRIQQEQQRQEWQRREEQRIRNQNKWGEERWL